MKQRKMWVVGVENIHPQFGWARGKEPLRVQFYFSGTIVWHTEVTARLGLPPHRTTRYGADELDVMVQFMRSVKECGYEVIEPPTDAGA